MLLQSIFEEVISSGEKIKLKTKVSLQKVSLMPDCRWKHLKMHTWWETARPLSHHSHPYQSWRFISNILRLNLWFFCIYEHNIEKREVTPEEISVKTRHRCGETNTSLGSIWTHGHLGKSLCLSGIHHCIQKLKPGRRHIQRREKVLWNTWNLLVFCPRRWSDIQLNHNQRQTTKLMTLKPS